MNEFCERTLIVLCILFSGIFLFVEAEAVFAGIPPDTPSYAMFYDLFLKHGLFEKTGIGIPDLSWIEMYPIGSLIFFLPMHMFIKDVLSAALWTHILVGVLSLIAIIILIHRRNKESLPFFQYFLFFMIFSHSMNFVTGRTSELQIILFATLFFLTERRERVFLLPLMFFTNATVAFPYLFLIGYVSYKERNFLFIPAFLTSLLSIVPFLHSFYYPNIASVSARYNEGSFSWSYLISAAIVMFFSEIPFFSLLSFGFLVLALLSYPIGPGGLNAIAAIPFIRDIFPGTWIAFFGFLGIFTIPKKTWLVPLLLVISILVTLTSGIIPHELEDRFFNSLDHSKSIFMNIREKAGDAISIDSVFTSRAYLRGYDIDITPMHWFADKRYISELNSEFAGKTCGDLPFLKSRGFEKIVLLDLTYGKAGVKEYLDSCGLSYRLLDEGINYTYVIDVSSFSNG